MPESEYTHTMVATLGGQPQIITFTLDLLLRNNFPVHEVFVIHPKPTDPRLQHSLECLRTEFTQNRYQIDGRTINCRFASRVLHLNNLPYEDIRDDPSAIGAHETIYHLIRELKHSRQRIIHLSATGGRRVMSLLAISAAQLNFNHLDYIWHIYTPKEFRQQANEGAIMHALPEDGVSLIKVPFVPWGDYFPYLPKTPDEIARSMYHQMVPEERERCDMTVKALTKAELQTLRTFAKGLKRQQVADTLCLSPKTIDTYKTKILKICHAVWNVSTDQSIDYHFLKEHFAKYFDNDEYTPVY